MGRCTAAKTTVMSVHAAYETSKPALMFPSVPKHAHGAHDSIGIREVLVFQRQGGGTSCPVFSSYTVHSKRRRLASVLLVPTNVVVSQCSMSNSKGLACIGAVDQGTQSTRFILYNLQAQVVASHREEFQQISAKPGWGES